MSSAHIHHRIHSYLLQIILLIYHAAMAVLKTLINFFRKIIVGSVVLFVYLLYFILCYCNMKSVFFSFLSFIVSVLYYTS